MTLPDEDVGTELAKERDDPDVPTVGELWVDENACWRSRYHELDDLDRNRTCPIM